jgi:hypothetical protein
MIKSHQLNMLDIAYLHQKQTLHQSRPAYLSAVAIYRFEGDRIAEDWGIAAKAAWP